MIWLNRFFLLSKKVSVKFLLEFKHGFHQVLMENPVKNY